MAKRTRTKSHPRRSRGRSGSTSVVVSAIIGVLAAAWYVWGEDVGVPFPAPSGDAETSAPETPDTTSVAEADGDGGLDKPRATR